MRNEALYSVSEGPVTCMNKSYKASRHSTNLLTRCVPEYLYK